MKELAKIIVLLLLLITTTADAQISWCGECVSRCVIETGAPVTLCEQVCVDMCPEQYRAWLPVV